MYYFIMYLILNSIVYLLFKRKLKPHWIKKFKESNKRGNDIPVKMIEKPLILFNILLLPLVLLEDLIIKIYKKIKGRK